MAKNRRNIILRIQDWIESVAGQTFLNYAYSWGAAVVILGALFKLTHIPGANAMLFIGMGTEVVVFFISGFDRPAALKREEELERAADSEDDWDGEEDDAEGTDAEAVAQEGGVSQGGTVFAGGQSVVGQPVIVGGQPVAGAPAAMEGQSAAGQTVVVEGGQPMGGQPVVVGGPVVLGENPAGGASFAQGADNLAAGQEAGPATTTAPQNGAAQPFDLRALSEMVAASNAELFAKVLEDARNASTPEMKEAAEAYVEELKTLTDTLARVTEQAEHMTRDSKEMDNLNRTLTGINTIYEMQLKSISTQVGTIDQINEQTRKMARQIEELNSIYNRMIQALTVNMRHAPGASAMDNGI